MPSVHRSVMRFMCALVLAVAFPAAAAAQVAAGSARERVGESAGVPVYRDQLAGATEQERSASARELVVTPAIREYFQAHRAEIEPSPADLARALVQLEAAHATCGSLRERPIPREHREFVVRFLLGGQSVMRHLHARFGGGRLLFQQGGVEAFDATRRLAEHLEAQGRIRFDDPALRALAYDYWTRDHGPFLIDDDAHIREILQAPAIVPCADAPTPRP